MGSPLMLPARLQGLLRAGAYPHPVHLPTVIETRDYWTIRTGGDYSYKIFKPAAYDAAADTGLLRRFRQCHQEWVRNQVYGPEIYLDVVPISGSADAPKVGGDGEPFEFALQLREIACMHRLDQRLADDAVGVDAAAFLGRRLGTISRNAPRAPAAQADDYITRLQFNVWEDAAALTGELPEPRELQARRLLRWLRGDGERLAALAAERAHRGYVSEVHGNLSVRTLMEVDGDLVPVDATELEVLRFADPMHDLATLSAALKRQRRPDLACALLAGYVGGSGDVGGLAVLRYFELVDVMLQAQVDWQRWQQAAASEQAAIWAELCALLDLGERLIRPQLPVLAIVVDPAGRSRAELPLCWPSSMQAFHLCDVSWQTSTRAVAPFDAASVADMAETIVGAGLSVVVEGDFVSAEHRRYFHALSARLGVPFFTFWFESGLAGGAVPDTADVIRLTPQQNTLEEIRRRWVLHTRSPSSPAHDG